MYAQAEPLSVSTASGHDRRALVRQACSIPVIVHLRPWWLLGSSWPAVLCNISTHGICLHTHRAVKVGSVLFVEFSGLAGSSAPRRLRAEVLHATQTPILRDWVLGCALRGGDLTGDELRHLVG